LGPPDLYGKERVKVQPGLRGDYAYFTEKEREGAEKLFIFL